MDNWRWHQFIGLIFICIYLCWNIYRKYGPLEALLTFSALLSSAVMFSTLHQFWGNIQPRIEATSAQTFAKIFMMGFLAVTFEKWRDYWVRIIEFFILINSIIVIIWKYGIFNATSFDAAIIACSLPIIWLHPEGSLRMGRLPFFLLGALPIIAILRTGQSSTPYFVIAGSIISYAFCTKKYKSILILMLVALMGYYINGQQLLNSSQRIQSWKQLFSWWKVHSDHFVGTGIGSFEWIGPSVQILDGQKTGLMMWLHNDYLQILFEGGFLIFTIAILLWSKVVFRSFSRPWLFCTVGGLSVCMLSYHPLRFTLSQFLMLSVVCEALWKKSKS